MSTVQEVLAKPSWDENDIKVLMANVSTLPIQALVKLGLAPASTPIQAVEEPVKEDVPVVSEEVKEEQSLPPVKKRGRPSKK